MELDPSVIAMGLSFFYQDFGSFSIELVVFPLGVYLLFYLRRGFGPVLGGLDRFFRVHIHLKGTTERRLQSNLITYTTLYGALFFFFRKRPKEHTKTQISSQIGSFPQGSG